MTKTKIHIEILQKDQNETSYRVIDSIVTDSLVEILELLGSHAEGISDNYISRILEGE